MDDTTDRHYRYHLISMALGLAFSVSLGAGVILALMRPGIQMAIFAVPVLFLLVSVALGVVMRRQSGKRWWPEERRLGHDEWVRTNFGRARRVALLTVCFAQVPLMFLVAYLPPDPTVGSSVTGMAGLTLVVAEGAFFASYLFYSRQPSDE